MQSSEEVERQIFPEAQYILWKKDKHGLHPPKDALHPARNKKRVGSLPGHLPVVHDLTIITVTVSSYMMKEFRWPLQGVLMEI